MQILPAADKVTMLYPYDLNSAGRLNERHPAHSTPRWYGIPSAITKATRWWWTP